MSSFVRDSRPPSGETSRIFVKRTSVFIRIKDDDDDDDEQNSSRAYDNEGGHFDGRFDVY